MAVKLSVVSCPPVVEVLIKRPDTKYQLGFSVQNGVVCSLTLNLFKSTLKKLVYFSDGVCVDMQPAAWWYSRARRCARGTPYYRNQRTECCRRGSRENRSHARHVCWRGALEGHFEVLVPISWNGNIN
jgi:hypothetical protein